jgi:hypothetical protein
MRGGEGNPHELLLANLLQSSRSTFYCGSFPSFFAFQEGIWDPQISALLGSPTVSGRFCACDVTHFMRSLNIQTLAELRRVDHRAVMAWERLMSGQQRSLASTMRRRLAALSSLFTHLVKFGGRGREPGEGSGHFHAKIYSKAEALVMRQHTAKKQSVFHTELHASWSMKVLKIDMPHVPRQ